MQKTNENNLLLIPNHTLQIADEQLEITELLLMEIANETEDVHPEFFDLLLHLAYIKVLESNSFTDWEKKVKKANKANPLGDETLISSSMEFWEYDNETEFLQFLWQYPIPKSISAEYEKQNCEQILVANIKKTDDLLITTALQPLGVVLLIMFKEYFNFESWAEKIKSQLVANNAEYLVIKDILNHTSFQNLDKALKVAWNLPMNETVFEIINQQKPNEVEKEQIVGKRISELSISFLVFDEEDRVRIVEWIDIEIAKLEKE